MTTESPGCFTTGVTRVGACVAWAHLVFNVAVALLFLGALRWIEPPLARRLGVAGR